MPTRAKMRAKLFCVEDMFKNRSLLIADLRNWLNLCINRQYVFGDTATAFQSKSQKELERAHLLFRMVDNSWFTKFNSWFFSWKGSINLPFVKPLIRKTVYAQFVGGETTEQCLRVAQELVQENVYSILDYSVEGKSAEKEFEATKDEILNLIQLAAENREFPFVVFKPTAFGKIALYEKVGKNAFLTEQEQVAWENVRRRFLEVCERAAQHDVTVMIDAEESWMQDAADELALEMMRRFNQERCIVCNTLQMYRHDRLAYLCRLFDIAESENFLLGFKLVRGAYMEKERARAEEKGYSSPIHPNKAATDKSYDDAVRFVASNTHRISVFAGTHNEASSQLLAELIIEKNLPKDLHKIWFGQLYGMSDNISFILADQGYNVAKYLPYGPIAEVMPYLIRRVNENTSVKGQSGRELTLINQEIQRRKNANG